MKILSEKNISQTEVLRHLEQEDAEEMKRRQRATLEHLQKHTAVNDPETMAELIEELEELDTFNANQIMKIIELLPETEQEVRTLFSKERIKLDDEDVDAVLSFTGSVERA